MDEGKQTALGAEQTDTAALTGATEESGSVSPTEPSVEAGVPTAQTVAQSAAADWAAQTLRREREGLAAEQRRTQDERARLVAEEQLRQIGELDGEIHSMDDLLDMEDFGPFYARVKKGLSLTEAFKLTRYEALVEKAAARAARQAEQAAAGKQHMTSLAGGAGRVATLSVPAEVAAQFRMAKPDISEAEIRRKYRKYLGYKRQ